MIECKPDEDENLTDDQVDELVYGWQLEAVDTQEEYLIDDD